MFLSVEKALGNIGPQDHKDMEASRIPIRVCVRQFWICRRKAQTRLALAKAAFPFLDIALDSPRPEAMA